MKRLPEIGQQFGRLKVIGDAPLSISRCRQYQCVCECGTIRVAAATHLTNGHVKSCGCLRRDRMKGMSQKIHGMVDSPEYLSWKSMKQRCGNPKSKVAVHYAHRQITFCPEWNDFTKFLQDVGRRPGPKYSLERIDNDGNYEPNNVKWATKIEQMNNTRRNHRITFNGQTLTLTQWAHKIGIMPSTLDSRINRLKWPIEKALKTPTQPTWTSETAPRFNRWLKKG